MSVSILPNELWKDNNWFFIHGRETDLDIDTWVTIITRTASSDTKDEYTDICLTANCDGEIRLLINDNEVCYKYYSSRSHFVCARKTPIIADSSMVIKLQFKPDVSSASVSADMGGITHDQ